MKKLLTALAASLLLVSSAAFAVPSAQQIEQAMTQGNWQKADAGLTEVLQAHPNNAHAHYLYAQVLDREGRYDDALSHFGRRNRSIPQLKFTDPIALRRDGSAHSRRRESRERRRNVARRTAAHDRLGRAESVQSGAGAPRRKNTGHRHGRVDRHRGAVRGDRARAALGPATRPRERRRPRRRRSPHATQTRHRIAQRRAHAQARRAALDRAGS